MAREDESECKGAREAKRAPGPAPGAELGPALRLGLALALPELAEEPCFYCGREADDSDPGFFDGTAHVVRRWCRDCATMRGRRGTCPQPAAGALPLTRAAVPLAQPPT